MTEPAYDPIAAVWNWLTFVPRMLTDPSSPFWWPTLLAILLGVALLAALTGASWRQYRHQAPPGGWRVFLRQLPSDLGLMLANSSLSFVAAPLLFGATLWGSVLGSLAPVPIFGVPGDQPAADDVATALFCAFLAFACGDFMLYWTHRLFHGPALLWRAHRLHHAPQTLTPLTAFRFWPQEQILHLAGAAFGTGFGIGCAATILGGSVTLFTLLGVNAFTLAWNLGFSHLRHSHIALSFPRWMSYLLVSPLMHQAHHSADPAQHNRNFATVFALWDWVFGTLYLPAPEERFRFGLDESDAER